MFRSILTGSGCYIPTEIQSNEDFSQHSFYSAGKILPTETSSIVRKFKEITGIEQRRYVTEGLQASDIGALAARAALADSGTDPEEIDQIIVAHNFGDVRPHTIQSVAVPSLANRVKHLLGIQNPNCVAYDLLFGCPGWVQGMIQANSFFISGLAKKALVIGTETLSRVIDPHDRDSMIFSDGAGAVVMEYRDVSGRDQGYLSGSMQSHSVEEVEYINMEHSDLPECDPAIRFIKMKGRKVYEYALKYVPAAMKDCLDKSGVPVSEVKKIFIHQANEKMDDAIIQRFYKLYDQTSIPENIMPMSIQWLGNSSVATIPTLYDLVRKGKIPGHELVPGDILLFASVGAGMNINCVCYRY